MNTEKRYLLAIALSFVVLLVFYGPLFNKSKQNITAPGTVVTPSSTTSVNPTATLTPNDKPEPLAPTEKTYELQNEIYTAEFTTRGGGILNLRLKEWGKRKMGEINLIEKSPEFDPAFSTSIQGDTSSKEGAIFNLENIDTTQNKIVFVREIPGELRIRKTYEFIPQKPALHLLVELENLSTAGKDVALEISNQLHFTDSHDRYEKDQIESFVALQSGKVLVQKEGKIKKNSFVVSEPIEWQALTRKYLSVVVKPDSLIANSETTLSQTQDAFQSKLRLATEKLEPNSKVEHKILIYAGPEYYNDLKEFGLEETLIQGTWGAFRHWLFLGLRFCRKITGGYGFAILLMTFLLKALFSPLTHMSFESMRKMQTIQPKMKAIQTQFKNDPTRLNKETMELYKRYKVNPMSGCFPMLIQIPIFIGFYQVLAQFVELKGESFFWIKDLTLPDRLAKIPGLGFDFNLLPLIMIATMILQQKVTPQPASSSPEQAKVMQFMPIIFGFMFYSLPSGLVLYWTLNNLLTVIHQSVFHRRPNVTVLAD